MVIPILLSAPEKRVLRTFRQFLMTPGQMLCFSGPDLAKNRSALDRMSERNLLCKEKFKGAYSLTKTGFEAMKGCEAS